MLSFLRNLFNAETPRDALGDRGENVAARYLRNRGYKIIVRNFRCDLGEIDIVARDGKTLVFVEVKTRRLRGPGPGRPGQPSQAAPTDPGRQALPPPLRNPPAPQPVRRGGDRLAQRPRPSHPPHAARIRADVLEQWPVVSGRWPEGEEVASGEWPVASGQKERKWPMASGQWPEEEVAWKGRSLPSYWPPATKHWPLFPVSALLLATGH